MSCFKFLKIMMFFSNSIIFLAGGAILGVGVWVKLDSGSLLNFLSRINNAPSELSQVLNVAYLLIAVGAVLLVIGFLGCCGAAQKSKCMLMLFFIIVLIIFIAEVAGATLVLAFKSLVTSLVDTVGREAVKKIHSAYGMNQDFTGILNTTMDELKCCGFYGYNDFTGSAFTNMTQWYPTVCCGSAPCNETGAHQSNVTGCYDKVVRLIEDNAVVLGGVALGIAALEVAAMAVAMTLYCEIGKQG